MANIHRASLSGGAQCGAEGRISISNHGMGVTCPECIKAEAPDRAAQEASIVAAARAFRGASAGIPCGNCGELFEAHDESGRCMGERNPRYDDGKPSIFAPDDCPVCEKPLDATTTQVAWDDGNGETGPRARIAYVNAACERYDDRGEEPPTA